MKNKVLFVCKGNSGRSQMAEAFFDKLSKTGKAISAGINPDKKIHPWTIQVMKEVGIDVSKQKTRLLTDELIKEVDKIIVMDSDVLENIPKEYLSKVKNWKIEKPLGKPIEKVREIRDSIRKKVEQLVKEKEIISIVNEDDEVVGCGERSFIKESELLNRQIAIFILNSSNEVLLQKRIDNKKYDFSVAGHVLHEEDYTNAALREAKEELGIEIQESDILKIKKEKLNSDPRLGIRNKIVCYFKVKDRFDISDFKVDRNAIDLIKFFSIKDIKKMIKKDSELFTQGFILGFKSCQNSI